MIVAGDELNKQPWRIYTLHGVNVWMKPCWMNGSLMWLTARPRALGCEIMAASLAGLLYQNNQINIART